MQLLRKVTAIYILSGSLLEVYLPGPDNTQILKKIPDKGE